MLTVWYANRTEQLVDALASTLRRRRPGLFEAVPIVVPHGNLGRWLRFELSRRLGVAGRLQLVGLVDFFEGLVAGSGVVPLRPLTLRHLLHGVLTDLEGDGSREAELLETYVRANATAPEQVERRAYGLAGQVAHLLTEYRLHRPELVAAWPARRTQSEEPWRTLEQWQRHLYLRIFGRGGQLETLGEQRGVRFVPLVEVLDHVAPVDLDAPDEVYVFGLGPIAPAFTALISKLSELRSVHVYALNPSSQFWEELQTGSVDELEALSSAAVTGGHIGSEEESTFWAAAGENALLKAWGRPGRDQIWALNRLTGHMAQERYVDPVGRHPTLLRALQQDILYAVPANEEREPLEEDGSVLLLDCPGIQREAEEIANAIWTLMRTHADEGLRLNEIAVLVNEPQRQVYAAHLAAAFDANRRLPMNLIDEKAQGPSRMLDAIHRLLDLPFGTFRRQELLRLMVHPNVVGRFGDVDPATWVGWCESLSIIHGGDRSDHAETYIDADVFNWDQGLRRLVLGAFMTDDDDALCFEAGEDRRYIPESIEPSQLTSVARLVSLARSLIADARWLREHRTSLSGWGAVFAQMVDTYVVTTEDDNPDHLLAWRRALARMGELDLDGHEMSYLAATCFARSALAEVELHDGLYSGEGVVVGSLASARLMPFRVVFVAGLTEGRFPTSDSTDPLDLRALSWQRGDVSARDRDRYDFLLAVLSARDRLILSWPSVDATTGDDLEPSGVVLELGRALEAFGVPVLSGGACTIRHLSHRFDPAYFGGHGGASPVPRSHHRAALAEAQTLTLRRSVATALGLDATESVDLRALRRVAPEAVQTALAGQLQPWQGPNGGRRAPAPTRIALTLRRLADFLADPLQATASMKLTASFDAWIDVLDVEHEPFESDRRVESLLLRRVVRRAMSGGVQAQDTATLYDGLALRLVMRGELPVGVFQEAARRRHLGVVEVWRQNLTRFDLSPDDRLTVISHGREETDGALPAPPLSLRVDGPDGEPILVELFGLTEGWVESRDTLVSFVGRETASDRDFLRALVTHVVLCSTGGEAREEERRAVVSSTRVHTARTKVEPFIRAFPRLEADEAQAWLQALLSDMVRGEHDYLLPLDAVASWVEGGLRGSIDAHVEAWLRRSGPRLPQTVRDLRAYGPPPDAEAIVRRRLGILYPQLGRGWRP